MTITRRHICLKRDQNSFQDT